MIDAEAPNITDVPYEAAIAAFGALFAGIFGLFASYCRKSRVIRIIYAFLSLRKYNHDWQPQKGTEIQGSLGPYGSQIFTQGYKWLFTMGSKMTALLVALACSVFCFAKTITILGKILKQTCYGDVEDKFGRESQKNVSNRQNRSPTVGDYHPDIII